MHPKAPVKEADTLPFKNTDQNKNLDAAAILDMHLSSWLLNRNRSNRMLQFAYDSVAEHLAAGMLAANPDRKGIAELVRQIQTRPKSGLAKALEFVSGEKEPEAV